MNPRYTYILSASALAVLGLLTLVGVGAVNHPSGEPSPTGPARAPAVETREGTLETLEGTLETDQDTDGGTVYRVSDGTSSVPLGVGPPWFYGDDHPLAELVGQRITVIGQRDDGTPGHEAVPEASGHGQPSFEVYSVNGIELRAPGKPRWAGGPAAVGDRHPGLADRSDSHAETEDVP